MKTLEEEVLEAFGILKHFVVSCYEYDGEEFMDLECEVCDRMAGHYQGGAYVVSLLEDLAEHVGACKPEVAGVAK